jgi:hypothetical protein
MIDEGSPNHVALFVSDLADSSLDALSPWNLPFRSPTYTIHSRQDTRTEELTVEARRVRTVPESVFAVTVERGFNVSFIRPNHGLQWHHVGFWSDDLEGDAARLEDVGYVKDVWWLDDYGRITLFVYMISQQGLRVELTHSARDLWIQAFRQEYEAGVAADAAAEVPLPRRYGRRVHHLAAVLDDPQAEARALEKALGIRWGDSVESEAEIVDQDGPRLIVTRSLTSLSRMPMRFVFAEFPVADRGWDHVAFQSEHLMDDVVALEQAGYRQRARWNGSRVGEKAVLMSAPEGTRVKLVANGMG